MWTLAKTDEYERRHKRFEKKRPRELAAVLDNDTFFTALQGGAKPQQIRMGCIHAEPHGVLAIDQKGGGKNLAQTRLLHLPRSGRRDSPRYHAWRKRYAAGGHQALQ